MPIPFQQTEDIDPTPLQGANDPRINSSLESTYDARNYQTLDDSFLGKDVDFAQGLIKQRDGSKMLSPDDVKNQYGLVTNEPVSQDYAQYAQDLNTRDKQAADLLARGGDGGAGKTWMGFGMSTAVGMLDVPSDIVALATDGVTKLAPVGKILSAIDAAGGPIASKAAKGAIQGLAFSAALEPIHALTDKDWSLSEAAQRLGSAALFMGLTHSLVGDRPLRVLNPDDFSANPYDVSSGEEAPEQAAMYELLEDHLQPETKQSMMAVAIARSMQGKSVIPIDGMIGLDPRIVAHEAAAGGTALSTEERLNVLMSMDDGTYVPPVPATIKPPIVGSTLPSEAPIVPSTTPQPKEEQSFIDLTEEQWNKMPDSEKKDYLIQRHGSLENARASATAENFDTTPIDALENTEVTLPEKKSEHVPIEVLPPKQKFFGSPKTKASPPTINITPQPITPQALTTSRLLALRNKLQVEDRQPIPQITFGKSPDMPSKDLTVQTKQATLSLQQKELPEKVQNEKDKQLQLEDRKSEGQSTLKSPEKTTDSQAQPFATGKAFFGLSHPDGSKGSIRNIKGKVTLLAPNRKQEFPTLEEAKAQAKELGFKVTFVEPESVNPEEIKAKALAKKQEAENEIAQEQRVEEHHLEQEFPTTVESYSLPDYDSNKLTENIKQNRIAETILKPFEKAIKKLGYYLLGERHDPNNYHYLIKMEDYDNMEEQLTDEASKLFFQLRDTPDISGASLFTDLPKEIQALWKPEMLALKEEYIKWENQALTEYGDDETRMLFYSYQLPQHPLAGFMEDFKQLRLIQDASKQTMIDKPEDHIWFGNSQGLGHVHFAVLKDVSGQKYVGVFEMQGHKLTDEAAKAANMPPRWDVVRRLAQEVKKFADEKGLPVVMPDAETASRVYRGTNEPISKILAESYGTKNGYVPKGFKRAWQMKGQPLKEFTGGDALWMPFEDDKQPFSGYVMPNDSDINTLTPTERINKMEDERQPAYEEAKGCVLK